MAELFEGIKSEYTNAQKFILISFSDYCRCINDCDGSKYIQLKNKNFGHIVQAFKRNQLPNLNSFIQDLKTYVQRLDLGRIDRSKASELLQLFTGEEQ
jgi:hypothetical protein